MKFTILFVASYLIGASYARYSSYEAGHRSHANSEFDEGSYDEGSYDDYNEEITCQLSHYPPNPNRGCCGIDTTSTMSIVGGDTTGLKQYPWLALVQYKQLGVAALGHYCDGILISGKYVVSAAHCFDDKTLKAVNVVLGEYDTNHKGRDCVRVDGQRECTEGDLRMAIEKLTIHEKYNPKTFDNDIALIKLKKTAPYRDYIRPICLPTFDITVNPPEGLTLSAAGWGAEKQVPGLKKDEMISKYPTIKRHVHLPYVNKTECNKVWAGIVPEHHLCAGGETGKDVCLGDSGGPLMYDNDGTFEAVGIVSFVSDPCGNFPASFTNVYRYVPWLHSQIRLGKGGHC